MLLDTKLSKILEIGKNKHKSKDILHDYIILDIK